MKITRFEEIQAWQEARILVRLVYEAVKVNGAFCKDYRLLNQIQSAAVSAMSNTCPVKLLEIKCIIPMCLEAK